MHISVNTVIDNVAVISGDMLTTAVSVARNCAMVGQRDRVVIMKASQSNDHEVCIDYELDETSLDTSPEQSDFDNEVGTCRDPRI